MKPVTAILIGLTLACGVMARGEGPETASPKPHELRPVTLMCQWMPQAQFVGYYLAREKGFYRRYGLEVTIRHANPSLGSLAALQENKVQFATTFLASAMVLNGTTAQVVNIAQLFRHSSLLIVARKSDGIKKIADLNGHRIGIWYSDFEDIPLRFLAEHHLQCHPVMIGSGVNMFLHGGIEALVVTGYNELHCLFMAGLRPEDLTLFRLNEEGLDIPEDGIYCRREFYERNRKLCRDFARASLEGWRYAEQHREEALELVVRQLKEAHVPLAPSHQRWMLREVLQLIFPPETAGGPALTEENYRRIGELLKSSGKISGYVPFNAFYYGNK
ncbi:MAG: ABC transporter substrate-binding protein [Victivallales bacterium]|nr:ABC transporter substrate-binding protein [Victivallales bacterium]